MKQLEGKVAIITAGTFGIGKTIVELFVQHGAKVIIADMDEKLGNLLINNLGEGDVIFMKADTSNPADNQKIVETAIENFGTLDIAINIPHGMDETTPGDNPSIEQWKKVMDNKLNSIYYAMHYQLAEISKTGGCIVNLSSLLGAVEMASSPANVAANQAVIGLTQTAGHKYLPKKVRVNAIGSAFLTMPLVEPSSDSLDAQHATLSRLSNDQEVAELILWLASDEASLISSCYYPVADEYLVK